MPVISEGNNAVKKVTQFSRQAHWLAERRNPTYNRFFKWSLRWVPGLMRLYRAKIYWQKERDFSAFSIKDGSKTREAWSRDAARYIRANAPAKYRDFLVPKTAIGCKRQVNDTHYLLSLHRDNVELIYDDPIAEIVEEGVRTQSGRLVRADAITLATGFETQNALYPMKIFGEGGIDINDHVCSHKASILFCQVLIQGCAVEKSERWCLLRLLWNMYCRLSEHVLHDGTEHPLWSSFSHLHIRVSDQFHNACRRTYHTSSWL